jgi:hypothetical protein
VDFDSDQDNDMDILGNNFIAADGLLWYEQTAPLTFLEHLIPYPRTHGGAAGDIDGDGDIDLAGAACGSSISWFENDGTGTGIVFIKDKLDVDVHRDHVTGDIIIRFGNHGSGQYEVELLDTMGRICFSAISGTSGIVIPANKVKKGIYLLRVVSSGKQFVMKIYTV